MSADCEGRCTECGEEDPGFNGHRPHCPDYVMQMPLLRVQEGMVHQVPCPHCNEMLTVDARQCPPLVHHPERPETKAEALPCQLGGGPLDVSMSAAHEPKG